LQTTAQQDPSLHPPLSWASKQPPLQGQFHPLPDGTLQSVRANVTQTESHSPWQHTGSALHTPLQHDESLQPGLWWVAKQLPADGHDSGAGQTA
jgi:hypothetical protein